MKDRTEWRLCFIFNPSANRARNTHLLGGIRTFVRGWGNGSELLVSGKEGDIINIAREAAKHFDGIVACGGDGTVRDIAMGIRNSEVVLGILPIGSGNDLSKTLGIPSDLNEAMDLLKTGEVKRIDAGSFNGQLFVNTFGIGFDGLTNRYANRFNHLKGSVSYIIAAIKAMFTYRTPIFDIDIDGEKSHKKLLMITIANGKVEGGNFWLTPNAEIDDGFFDVLFVDKINRLMLPFYFIKVLRKTHLTLKPVHIIRAKKVTIQCSEEVDIHVDGEILEKIKNQIQIEILPRLIRVISNV